MTVAPITVVDADLKAAQAVARGICRLFARNFKKFRARQWCFTTVLALRIQCFPQELDI